MKKTLAAVLVAGSLFSIGCADEYNTYNGTNISRSATRSEADNPYVIQLYLVINNMNFDARLNGKRLPNKYAARVFLEDNGYYLIDTTRLQGGGKQDELFYYQIVNSETGKIANFEPEASDVIYAVRRHSVEFDESYVAFHGQMFKTKYAAFEFLHNKGLKLIDTNRFQGGGKKDKVEYYTVFDVATDEVVDFEEPVVQTEINVIFN